MAGATAKKIYYALRHYGLVNEASHMLMRKRLRPFILCYHQVHRDEFHSHVRYIKSRFPIVSISEFGERLAKGYTEAMCTLTLDDCIREDVEKAVDVATAEAVPLTLYLPSDYSFAQRSLWSNKVVAVIQAKSRVALNGREFAVQTPKEKVAAKDFFLSYFHALTLQTSALEQLVDTWISENGIAPNELRDGLSVLSTYEVKSYAQLPHIQFESHTCSHPFLNLLSQEEILRELSQSKYDIEAITGKPVTSLCFPYGSAAIVGSVAPKIARQFYSTATTLIGGVCGPKADLYFLPRIGIYPGDGVKELAGKIYHFQTVNYLDGDKFTS